MTENTRISLPEHTVFPSNNDLYSWLIFLRDRRWSRSQKRALLSHFQCVDRTLKATPSEVAYLIKGRARSNQANIDKVKIRAELDWLNASNHHLLTFFDAAYPEILRHITDPPLALFAVGNLALLEDPMVAIVGSRRPSPVGQKVTADIASKLGALGIVIVSGLALGIDAIAHQAALDNDGASIAVLGCGMDIVYPSRHAKLYERLATEGLILSEYPLGVKPSRYTFPDRNRLVSGLCEGVVIVEAAERSGTLITARLAVEQNRELMVVPGAAVSDQYRGSHRLIREGAGLVSNAEDVLVQLSNELVDYQQKSLTRQNNHADKPRPSNQINPEKSRIIEVLDFTSISVDVVIERSGLGADEVIGLLLELELEGAVATTREGGYIRLA